MAGRLLAFVAAAAVTLAVGVGAGVANTGNGASAEHANSQATTTEKGNSSSAPGRQAPSSGSTTTTTTGSNGANQSGPYNPSGVGLPSGNGKSENNNGKRPCAGCVGKADAKNPPGQLPGGQDHNKGYECDENQGVGKTNPAHSGCSSSTTSNPPGNPPGGNPPGGNTPTSEVSPNQEVAQAPAEGAEAGQQESGENNPESTKAFGGNPTRHVRERLPFTGLSLVLMALTGMVMAGLGRVLRARTAVATPFGEEAGPTLASWRAYVDEVGRRKLDAQAMTGLGRLARRRTW